MGAVHDDPHDDHATTDHGHARRAGGPLRVGIGGPVGSGKTELVACLCRAFADELSVVVVTNDIFTTEDAAILERKAVLPAERIVGVRDRVLPAHRHPRRHQREPRRRRGARSAASRPDLVLVESGGDNLTATFSRALVDVQIFVIDVAGGDKVPRKGGPGHHRRPTCSSSTRSTSPPLVGADLDVMRDDAAADAGRAADVPRVAARGPAGHPDRRVGAFAGGRPGRGVTASRVSRGLALGDRRGDGVRAAATATVVAERAGRRGRDPLHDAAVGAAAHAAGHGSATACTSWAAPPVRWAATTCGWRSTWGRGRR